MTNPDFTLLQSVLVGSADDEMVALEAAMRRAQLDADVAALDALISTDLLFTGPDGRLGTKAEDLAAHSSGAVRFVAHEPQELRVRRLGPDAAITALLARLTVLVGGEQVTGVFRYTRIWAREDGAAWWVAGGHVSMVAAGSTSPDLSA